ncbi:MAG: hypothetical protein ACXW2P_13570 [Thermoanaerobaculia bacterium]
MKRLIAIPAMVLLTLPLAGGEKKAEKPASKATTKATAKPAVESPLAAAARKSGRGTSKRVVITDETLKKSTGHLSSTTSTVDTPPVPEIDQSAEVLANQERAKERADEVKRAEEVKLEQAKKQKEAGRDARRTEAAEQSEEGLEDDVEPAQLEKDLAEEAKKNP